MKFRATRKSAYTYNGFDDNVFTDTLVITELRLFSKYIVGGLTKKDDIISPDELKITFKKTKKDKKYLYHVEKMGGGLRYRHLTYIKLSWCEHIKLKHILLFHKYSTYNTLKGITQFLISMVTLYLLYKDIF